MSEVEELRELFSDLRFARIGRIVEELGSVGCEYHGFDAVGTTSLCLEGDAEEPYACWGYGVAESSLLWLAVSCSGRRYAVVLRDAVYVLLNNALYALVRHGGVVGVVESDAVFTRVVKKEVSAEYSRVRWKQFTSEVLRNAPKLASTLLPLAEVGLLLRTVLGGVEEKEEKAERSA